jgi:hypothetical protein
VPNADDSGVKHTVRSTLVVARRRRGVQRLCQLLGFVLIGRALGIAGLGTFAQGQALAAVLTVFAGAGVRSLTARTWPATRPRRATCCWPRCGDGCWPAGTGAAGRWRGVRAGAGPVVLVLEPAARAARGVRHEAAARHFGANAPRSAHRVHGRGAAAVAILGWFLLAGASARRAGGDRARQPVPLRAGAMPRDPARCRRHGVPTRVLVPRDVRVAFAHTVHELLTIGDVWLVAIALGDAAAGLYATGVRFAAAALMPSASWRGCCSPTCCTPAPTATPRARWRRRCARRC